MKKKPLLYLPHELIIEILLRLPVKSLICFKCVCKSWFSLISTPHFANSHFQLTTHTPRIMCVSNPPTKFCSIDFETFLNDDPRPASLSINFSLPRSLFPVEINGSCRGFIFLYRRPDIFLWNPSTGFKKQIPLSPFVSKLVTNYPFNHIYGFGYPYRHLYGFGYDQSRDDYLVVVLTTVPTVANVVSSHLEFFSIRDNRWKEIENTHLPYCRYRKGLFFNGAIHFMAFGSDLEIDVIVAFDLMEKKLFEMSLPDDVQQADPFDMGLWIFGGFLSLWAQDVGNGKVGKVEIWVMKEYNLNLSWTKTLVLSDDIPDLYFNPMFSTNNSDIIGTASTCSNLVKYNYKGQLMGYPTFREDPSDIVMYTESLLSLPCNNEKTSL